VGQWRRLSLLKGGATGKGKEGGVAGGAARPLAPSRAGRRRLVGEAGDQCGMPGTWAAVAVVGRPESTVRFLINSKYSN
jgi:hypothetical protein